ncbi:MAG: hypothetical protein DIU70_007285 [Bacillota bacterium]|nr:MAG: hypothetical protein DIU70_06290 [Bacillota bacterium]
MPRAEQYVPAGAGVATGAAARRIPVFDKYMLPKVAFTLVSTASLAGAVLTGLRHGWVDWHLLALRWLAYWFLAMLLGSEVWKIFYLRPSVALRPVPEAVAYGEAMIRLHRRWQQVLVPLAVAAAGGTLAIYSRSAPKALPWALLAGGALVTALVGIALGWLRPVEARRQEPASWTALLGLAAGVAAMGALDVSLQQAALDLPRWLLIGNRILHLWAFSAWLGGALWNIFIAVPAGRVRENMDTVILANFQLERFRVVVRAVFPTIVLTGLLQAWAMFGWSLEPYLSTTWGWLVLAKLGMILSLVGIFITCPMWGACSPIRGVCNLEDLFAPEEEEA